MLFLLPASVMVFHRLINMIISGLTCVEITGQEWLHEDVQKKLERRLKDYFKIG
jgi:hypothetical protein